MKNIKIQSKRLAVFLAFMFSVVCANAQNVTIEGLNYYLYPATHEAAVDVSTWSGELDIPSEVKYNDETFTVTSIRQLAFDGCNELTKVRIPKTIDHVVHHVLTDDPNIVGSGDNTCMNPFYRCRALESIEVDEENPIFKAVDGVLFSKDGTSLYCYPAGVRSEKYVVPECVTWIGGAAFGYNNHLVTAELPTTIKELHSTFWGCTRLEKINLPENLTYISAYMFTDCSSLKSIEIPSGVTNMGESVFRGCSSLESIVLPDNISFIGDLAFSGCTSLETIVLPSSLSVTQTNMFSGCTSLKTVTIPDGMTVISSYMFSGCSSLKELDLPESVNLIGWGAFKGCKFNHLIIRGILNLYSSDRYIFDGMDTSTIIYTPASQVESLKKIYGGDVLPLERYTSDIRPTKNLSDKPSPVYDLQGRRITTEPHRGLFVRNGKKILSKM
jgi:hypothetical protein